jgi:hypothetical protein
MFNPWFSLGLKALQMGAEAQSVIALRMIQFAAGGSRVEAEATRMITEKIVEAQAAAVTATLRGSPQHVIAKRALTPMRKRVSANKRRISRS